MESDFDKYLNFNKGQRRALFLLIILFVGLIIIRYNLKYKIYENYDYLAAYSQIEEFIQSIDTSTTKKYSQYKEEIQSRQIKLQKFNPNHTSYETYLELGLKPYQANSIIKYLATGAVFHQKTDMKKIYTLSAAEYQRLEPYIDLPTHIDNQENYKSKSNRKRDMIIAEINTATAEQLLEISGIGPVLSKNIIKYRQMIGGFYQISQLREVYGIDSLVYDRIKDSFVIERDSIKRFNLNKLTYYELRKHPYISNQQAFEISNHVKHVSPIKTANDLRKINSIDEETYEKIINYIEF